MPENDAPQEISDMIAWNARTTSCPKCGQKLTEQLNGKYCPEDPFSTATEFICEPCGIWICGCCGAAYGPDDYRAIAPLTKSEEWCKDMERLKEFVIRTKCNHHKNAKRE